MEILDGKVHISSIRPRCLSNIVNSMASNCSLSRNLKIRDFDIFSISDIKRIIFLTDRVGMIRASKYC